MVRDGLQRGEPVSTWTQTEIDTLRAAIASGVLTVSYDGPPRRMVTYQSTEAMLKVLALAQQAVNAAAGGTSWRRVATRKGV